MLAKDTLEEFKLECELRRLTPRTIKGYYNSTRLFLTWLERQQEIKELEAIRPQHLKQYIQHLIRKQLSPSYINAILRCLRAYFRFTVEEGCNPFPSLIGIVNYPWSLSNCTCLNRYLLYG